MTRFWVLLMKKLPLFSMALLLAGVLFAQGSRAEDYTRLNLPNDALARLGKGSIGRGDRAVAYSPDGVRLAVATSLGIWLYDARTGAEVALLQGHTHWVTSVSFSPDGQTVASGSGDRTVRLWDVSSGQSIAVLEGHTDGVHSVSFSPDGQTVASSGRDATVRLWDVSSGQPIAALEGHTHWVSSVSFSPDGQTVASGSGDRTVWLWDVSSGQSIAVLRGHTDRVHSVSFSPDGQTVASGSGDRTVRLWDVSSGQPIAALEGHTDGVLSVSFSPDGQTVASSSRDDMTVWLWDVSSGQPIAVLEGHTDGVISVSFSPDGQTVASGSVDRTVWLWDVSSGQPIAVLEGHTDGVISVSFSPDGQTVASGSADATILLWDMTFVLSAVNVFWGAAGYRVVEESEVAVSVRLHRAPERTVTIPLIRMPESGGYSGVPSTVTFTGDQTEQTFTLTATDDIVEAKTVSLRFGTLPEGVRSGSPATTVVSIAEDENLFNLLNDALARLGKGIMRALYAWLQHLLCLIGQVML